MVNTRMFVFKHPKYYKELRERNRDLSELQQVKLERSVPQSDQVISLKAHDGECERAPGPGQKPQASSSKPQAPSSKRQANQNQFRFKLQAPSGKRPNQSNKRQASSHKQQAP